MTGTEITFGILGTIGIADLIRLVIEKFFSRKKDHIHNQKDEFSALRERLDYNEKELNRLNKNQIAANRKISKMYSFMVRVTPNTCTKKDCNYRELISIDFDEFEDNGEELTNEEEVVQNDDQQQENA